MSFLKNWVPSWIWEPDVSGKPDENNQASSREDVPNSIDEGFTEIRPLVEDRVSWTASETIRKIQGGYLCKGILLTDDIDELLKEREAAVEVKDNLAFSGPLAPVETFRKEYSSQLETQLYQNNIDKSSSSKAFSASASYLGANVGGAHSTARNKEHEENVGRFTNETYVAVMHCEKVSVKSVNISRHDLFLNQHLIKDLQHVEQKIKHQEYKSRGHFENIFQTYGSHATLGVIDFGGILMSTASQRDFKESERSVITDIISDVSKTSLDVAFFWCGFGANIGTSFDASKLQEKLVKNYSTRDLKNIEVSLKQIGGPIECNDKMEWRKGLVTNSSLWRIIERNDQLVPLWELLESHQDQKSFENCALLANAMRTEWDKPKEMVDCMKKLANLRSTHIVSTEDWFEEVLYLPIVQEKIITTVDNVSKKKGSMEELLVRTSLRTILQPIKSIKSKHFKNIKEIERFLDDRSDNIHSSPFTIKTIKDIPKHLKAALKELDTLSRSPATQDIVVECVRDPTQMKHNDPDLEQKVLLLNNICQRLVSTIISWEAKHKPDFSYLVCLAVLHLHGFDLTQKSFEYTLEQDDICDIAILLNEFFTKIDAKTDRKQKQAFLLNLALNSSHNKHNTVKYMMDRMPGGVDSELRDCWEKAFANSADDEIELTNLKDAIKKYMGDESSEENLFALAQSIKRKLDSVVPKGQTLQTKEQINKVQFNLNESVEELLELLNLKQYYPQKLTYEEVILLTPDILKDVRQKPNDLSELPWYFMKQIIGLNSNVREECAKILGSEKRPVKQTDSKQGSPLAKSEKKIKYTLKDDWEEDWSSEEESNLGEEDFDIAREVHPLDVVTAVFLCADDFLRQELADKMAKCQYAVPFILPLPHQNSEGKMILHWGLKSISRIFRAKDSDIVAGQERSNEILQNQEGYAQKETVQKGKSVHKILIDVEGPLVSFISLGKETTWKLKLLNKMLSPHQETFWHRSLAGGHCQQKLSEGLAEVAWYLPGGYSDDKFSEPVSFVNFRGNALECPEVSDPLVEFSSVTCIFTSKIDKDVYSFLKHRRHKLEQVLLVVLYQRGDKAGVRRGCDQLKAKLNIDDLNLLEYEAEDANFDKVLESLKKSIETLSSGNHTSVSELVSKIKLSTNVGIDNEKCAEGLSAALDIVADIDEYNRLKLGSAKSIILPCQSDIETREQMAKCDKEACRQTGMHDGEIAKYVSEQENKKWKLELKQLQYPISKTFMKFLQYILNFRGSKRKYFLQGLKLELNKRSIELLQPLREEYQKLRVRDIKDEKGKKEREETLNLLGSRLTHGSLGLEHFFREIAVMFENIAALAKRMKSKLLNNILDTLAGVVAEMLMEGTAVELLDGDVVHSPVSWLLAVLDKVDGCTHAKVFKASVLGAQSSGKSTILNTAFGLNFPVSSGRCTRGVYMQLLKLREDLSEQMKCNYLLVIDSEGLMSRTLAERSDYDNELATFVIGLSDLTMVIVKGEGNEMQDVLPIAIHVFMRMNKIGEQQACRFVHQNMGAVDVEATSSLEIDDFIKMLDQKTLAAAKNTDQSEQYKTFTDVLHYDKVKDNTFVPGLWAGTPPMGKTDIHYHLKMQELKKDILLRIRDVANMKEHPTLKQFGSWLAEIWRAIKYENFVFSFKNVFAIEAYNKLTKIYNSRHRVLKNRIRGMIENAETTIPNLAMKIDVSIEEEIEAVIRRIEKETYLLTGELKLRIGNYFPCEHEKGAEKECCKAEKINNLQIDNKKEFEDNTNSLQRALLKEVQTRMDALKIKVQTNIRILQLSTEMDETLKRRVQELVREQKSKHLGKAEIERIFDKMWTDATGDIMRKVKLQDTEIDIKAIVQNTLLRLLYQDKLDFAFRKAYATRMPGSQGFKIQENHLRLKNFSEAQGLKKKVMALGNPFTDVSQSDYERLDNETKQIISSADEVYRLSTDGKEFVTNDVESLFLNVLDKIDAIKLNKAVITNLYKVDLLMYIEDRAARGFTTLHNLYRERSSPKALLRRKKTSYLILFKDEMGQGNTAVDLCNDALKGIVVRNVENKLSSSELLQKLTVYRSDIFDDIRKLQASIMVDLYKANDFGRYCRYISQYESTVKEKMMEVSIECFEKNNLLRKLAKTHLESIIVCMNEAVAEAVERFSDGGNFVEIFFHHLSGLWIPHEEITAYYNIKIEKQKECKQFGKLVLEQLGGPVRKEIEEEINAWSVSEKLAERNLDNYLFKEIVGCTKRCPFCKTPCDKHTGGTTGGDHSATLHRPAGLGGRAWRRDTTREDLAIEACPTDVASDNLFSHTEDGNTQWTPYKDYRSVYKDWQILPDADFESERYWKYVFAKYNKEWAKYYNAKPAKLEELGPQWMNYTVDDLKEEMNKYYNSTIDI